MKNVKFSHWMISIFIFFSAFITFFYIDLTSLTIWTTNIWECIFGEGLSNYYAYSSMNLEGIEHSIVGNDLLIYIPWAIWNLPIWLLSKAMGVSISTNIFMLCYSKLFLVLVFTGILFVTGKICKVLKMEDENTMVVLYLSSSSAFVLTAIAYAGQNDVLPIFFFLLGLLYLLKGKQVPFLLFVAFSIAMKPYMLFSVIILVLLIEKNPLKIIGKMCMVCSVYVLQKMILGTFPYYHEAMNSGAADGEIAQLLQAKISIAQYDVSVLVILLGIFGAFAYFNKASKEEIATYIIYYAVAPILLLFGVAGYSFYRPIYLVPLLYILMVRNKNIPQYFQLFLEIGLVACMYYQFLRVERLFYNPYYINCGILGRIFDLKIGEGQSFPEVMMYLAPNMGYYFAISSAVLLVIILLLLIINHPKFSYEVPFKTWENAKYLVYLRPVVYVVIVLVSISGLVILG